MNIVHTKEFLLVNIPRITPELLNHPIAKRYRRRSETAPAAARKATAYSANSATSD